MTARAPAGPVSLRGPLTVVMLGLAVASSRADVSHDLRTLPERREILLSDSLRLDRAWAEVREDALLAERSGPDFDDLRIADESGAVIPALVREPRLADHRLVTIGTASWSSGVDEHGQAAITVEIGGHPHDDLYVSFPVAVEGSVWGSENGLTWKEEAHPGMTPAIAGIEWWTVPELRWIGPTSARHLRVNVAPDRIPAPSVPATLYSGVRHEVKLDPVSFKLVSSTFEGWTWRGILELEGPPRALCRLSFVPIDGLRQRNVMVDARIEEGGWRRVMLAEESIRGAGLLEKAGPETIPLGIRPSDPGSAPGTLTWEPSRTGALRITVEGSDPPNAPITVTDLHAAPLRLAFPLPASGKVFLAYGDPYLGRPPQLPPGITEALLDVRPAALGEPGPNPHHDPPGFGLEWLKRRPAVLTGLMVAVLAVLALIALKWRPERGR